MCHYYGKYFTYFKFRNDFLVGNEENEKIYTGTCECVLNKTAKIICHQF